MNLLDLLGNDTPLHKVAGTHGGEYAGPCPWCGGHDRFRVWPHADKPGYWCRQCDRKGDAIRYLRDRHGLTLPDACARLGQPLPNALHQRSIPKPPPLAEAPGAAWQAQAQAFTESCERALWASAGQPAVAYLSGRGLQEATLRAAHVGYHASAARAKPEVWGFASDHKSIWLPRGIVFPWWVEGRPWRVVIR